MARTTRSSELPSQPDPRAPLDAAAFLRAARPVLAGLTADLLIRVDADPGIREALERHHAAELAASRTADDYPIWRRHVVVQVAAAWLLSCVFVRILEDRGLVTPRIAGAGARDSEAAFFRVAPSLGEREYLLLVFRELARLPAAAALFAPEHNLVWRLGPSAQGCKQLLALFRGPHADTPAFRFGQPDTRFLGDLYQNLDDGVRERFALLQTPDFVERFILDRTLDPAIAEYGVDHTDVIDPTCGSGHFLLGAFQRIFAHLRDAHPGLNDRELASATLDKIYGVDINPYAVSIARFRLTLQFLEAGGFTRLLGAQAPVLHVIVADSLYYGFAGEQGDLAEQPGQSRDEAAAWHNSGFSPEDPEAAQDILVRRTYAAVVGNPPYITVKDPALREVYRRKYVAAAGKYALSAPFMERFFQLAKRGGGYVGQITSNSFMKREFGAALIEKVLRHLDLELIVNTAGAYVPGHGTPTVLVFGRNRPPVGDTVDTVLANGSAQDAPADLAKGEVWRRLADPRSIEPAPRTTFHTHPWSLEGGGAVGLKCSLESRVESRLSDVADEIGYASFTGIDDMFLIPAAALVRMRVHKSAIRPLLTGESVRDWGVLEVEDSLCPYHAEYHSPVDGEVAESIARFLWPWRVFGESVTNFSGKTREELGEVWWHWYRWQADRYRAPFRFAYAEVATHNHFILDRGGKAFKQTAPIIKLPTQSTGDEHLGLLAYFNSSTACFWMKQVAYPKGTPGSDNTAKNGRPEANRYAFSGIAISGLPIPTVEQRSVLVHFARTLEHLQFLRTTFEPHAFIKAALDLDKDISATVSRGEEEQRSLAAQMVAVQEDLDWAIYAIFELAPPDTARRWTDGLELTPEQRPFNCPDPPPHLGPADSELWRARVRAIADSKELRLIENPVNKRRWWGARGVFARRAATFAERVADAATEQIADLAEQVLRARCERHDPVVFTARDLERELSDDPRYRALREYLVARDPRIDPLRDQLSRESVPFLAGHRYTASGRERHERWREVWRLQRIADVAEAELPRLRDALDAAVVAAREAAERLAEQRKRHGNHAVDTTTTTTTITTTARRGARRAAAAPELPVTRSSALLAAEARESAARGLQNQARLELEAAELHHRNLRKSIPVPSKYEPADFRDPAYFRLRGKLDVPRERFIGYPGAASDTDPAPVYGWAGWNHLQRALALLQLYYHRKLEEAWSPERLVPLLAGLEELLPWVVQWYGDERHADTGERYADALESHIIAGCGELGVTRAQLLAWSAPDARQARAARSAAATPSLANPRRARGGVKNPIDRSAVLDEPPPPGVTNKRRARPPAEHASAGPHDPIPALKPRRGRPRRSG